MTAGRLADAACPPHTSGMSRLLLILAIVFIVIVLWKSMLRKVEASNRNDQKKTIAHNMVRCDYCGLHVPEDTVVRLGGRRYCSDEHRALHKETRDK